MVSDKRLVLEGLSFGERIAEEEAGHLAKYFIETDTWRRMLAGDVDVVYGSKGAGKSAIYLVLLDHASALKEQKIAIIKAENQSGNPVFQDLTLDPPTSEKEFRSLWKLYFLSILGNKLASAPQKDSRARQVIDHLETCGLLDSKGRGLKAILRGVMDYLRRVRQVDGEAKVNPVTGEVSMAGSIVFAEPSTEEFDLGVRSVDNLLSGLNELMSEQGMAVWLAIDRLDVAFSEDPELESNALRALFRSYSDMKQFDSICLKIFIRSDIWKRITAKGFAEASHITRDVTLTWSPEGLRHLVVRRLLQNETVCKYLGVDGSVLHDSAAQDKLLSSVFPERIEKGDRRSLTFDWILARTRDGTRTNAPREIIHLLSAARASQLAALDRGEHEPEGTILIDRAAFVDGLKQVSKVRLENTIYAEYADMKPYIERLEGEKTEHSYSSLSRIWGIQGTGAAAIADQLVEIGIFEPRGTKESPIFWIPFLYRDGLNLVRGKDIDLIPEWGPDDDDAAEQVGPADAPLARG